MKIGIIEITILLSGIGFIVLIFSIIPLIHSLTRASKETEETIKEMRETIRKVDITIDRINKQLDSVDDITIGLLETLNATTKTLKTVNKKVLTPSLGLLSMIPAIKFGWDFISKHKKKEG